MLERKFLLQCITATTEKTVCTLVAQHKYSVFTPLTTRKTMMDRMLWLGVAKYLVYILLAHTLKPCHANCTSLRAAMWL